MIRTFDPDEWEQYLEAYQAEAARWRQARAEGYSFVLDQDSGRLIHSDYGVLLSCSPTAAAKRLSVSEHMTKRQALSTASDPVFRWRDGGRGYPQADRFGTATSSKGQSHGR